MGDSSTFGSVYSRCNFVFLEEVGPRGIFLFIYNKKLKFKMHLKKLVIILLFSGISNTLSAQLLKEIIYLRGEMITQKDTIKCYLEERENKYSFTTRYKLQLSDKKPLKIQSKDIIQIKFNGGKIYDRIKNEDNEFVLLKRLVSGPVRLYKDNLNYGGTTMVTPGGTMTTTGSTPDFYYLVKDDQIYKMSRLSFRESLKKIFTDNPEYEKLIEEIKYGTFIKNIEEIVKEYNKKASN